MFLFIDNVGPIGYADIELDGLTVLCSPSNSGKTTICRLAYELISGNKSYFSTERNIFFGCPIRTNIYSSAHNGLIVLDDTTVQKEIGAKIFQDGQIEFLDRGLLDVKHLSAIMLKEYSRMCKEFPQPALFLFNPHHELARIKKLLDELSPGYINQNNYILPNGRAFSVDNLSSSTRVFDSLKALLFGNKLNESTTLIIDDCPLSAKNQQKLAELLVLLVKTFNINVLLTINDTPMLLGIEGYMRKYDLMQKTHFYSAKMDNMVRAYWVTVVADALEVIYAQFVKPVQEMDSLIDAYTPLS